MGLLNLLALCLVIAIITNTIEKLKIKEMKINIKSILGIAFPYIKHNKFLKGKIVILMIMLFHFAFSYKIVYLVSQKLGINDFKIDILFLFSIFAMFFISLILTSYIFKLMVGVGYYIFYYYRGFKVGFTFVVPTVYIIYTSSKNYNYLPEMRGLILFVLLLSLFIIYRELIFIIIYPSDNSYLNKEIDFNLVNILISIGNWFIIVALNFVALIYHLEVYIQPVIGTGNNLLDITYYYFMTFLTIGYGDVIPINNLGKLLSIVISITSFLFIAVFISSARNSIKDFS